MTEDNKCEVNVENVLETAKGLYEKGDVDEAILRYLGEGGLVIALSTGPFPFYYSETGQAVVSARKLGFPIEVGGIGGWETPPSNIELTFEIDNTVLVGLPSSVPFPRTGDLSWRPSSGTELPDGDIYLPLAQLKDENGNYYGDGIAYIEHRFSEPHNGKNIYVWMRMLDVLSAGDALYALFHLAGERMSRAQNTTRWDVNCDGTVDVLDLTEKQLVTWGKVKKTELYQNYPNPFNPETWIPFSLSKPEHVIIKIYSPTGHLVRTLDLGQKPSGAYLSREKAAYWDGTNEAGEMVASDVYFYAMETDGKSNGSRKMIMAR